MPCYHLNHAWLPKSGKGRPHFQYNPQYSGEWIQLPCGQCIGCRIDKSRAWAVRCMHEAQTIEEDHGPGKSKFVTLTYAPEHLPKNGSLQLRQLQKFLKRYRKSTDHEIRYFACGEYGANLSRPHYHLILFNADLGETKQIGRTKQGHALHSSQKIERSWPYGYNWTGEVTFQSAAYVARYIMKKVNGAEANTHYNDLDKKTGEIYSSKQPEFITMSRRPGLGKDYYDRYKSDIYPSDCCIIDNKKYPVPSYYDKLLELEDPELLKELKAKRKIEADKQAKDQTTDRLRIREQFKQKQTKLLVRELHQ